jgi:ParB-like chromosome segregation protein Spo0J
VALIRPEIADAAVPAESVTPYPGNARRGDLDKIKNSLRKHGQYKELIVQDSTGYILIGNNTYAAMRELGYEQVAVKRLNVDEAKAREMLLIDNASSDEAIYDEAALAALLAEVQDWDAAGFDPDDLDDILVNLQQTGDPEALAAALPPAVAAAAPAVLPQVPATDARYSESPEDEAKRQEKFDTWTPRYARGLTEVILVYPEDTRTEVLDLVERIKKGTSAADARNGDVVLGALRLLAEVCDARRRGDLMVDVETALTLGAPPREAPPEAAAAEEQLQEQADVAADSAAAEAD